jgi:hypothetical protein
MHLRTMSFVRKFAVALIVTVTVLLLFRKAPGDQVEFIDLLDAILLAQGLDIKHFPSPSSTPEPYLKAPHDNSTDRVVAPRLVGDPVFVYPSPGKQTYPRAVKLQSGVLLAASTILEPEQSITLSSSLDAGISWIPYSTVVKSPAPDIQLNNPFLLELPSGRLLCALRAHTKALSAVAAEEKPGGQNEGYLYYRLVIYFSDDAGETWQHLSTPVQEPGPTHSNWEPFLRLSNSGVLQFYYSRELGGRDQDNLMRVSHDEGLSWSEAQIISGLEMETRDGMLGLQEIVPGSGHLMAVFESVEEKGDGTVFEGRFGIWGVVSTDDGITWGERKLIYESYIWDAQTGEYISKLLQKMSPNWCGLTKADQYYLGQGQLVDFMAIERNAGAPQITMVGETLVISFMTDEEKLEGMWHRNAYVKIIISADKGLTWDNKLLIAEKPAAWAGLLALNETDFLVLCDHEDRTEAQRVSLVQLFN